MSNHSSKIDEEMSAILKSQFLKEELGATNKYPEGKLTNSDEGELRFAVGSKDGKVVIAFGKPVGWMGMLPSQARDLANLLIQRADEIDHPQSSNPQSGSGGLGG